MDPLDIKAKAETLLKLHDRRKMLVLPNAWDAASERILAESGFAAIATTSDERRHLPYFRTARFGSHRMRSDAIGGAKNHARG